MPTITVKGIPDELYARLKQAALANHRSINKEIVVCIERAVHSHRLPAEEVLRRAQGLREKTRKHVVSDAEFTRAKRAGRQ